MQIGVGFSGHDSQDGVGILRDGEIHFKAKMVADNGLTFDARVELEATSQDGESGDTIDENWARVSGSFGSIKIGGDDSAKNAYNNGVLYAPGARVGYYDAFGLPGNNQMSGIAGSGDQVGIHYDSPNWMGFSFGASYRPNKSTDGNGGDSGVPVYEANRSGDQFWGIGAAYSGSMGDTGFGISAGYSDAKDSDEAWHVAGNVSFAGFTIAGGFEDDGEDSDEFYVGARYSTGPWTVAGGYADAEGRGGEVFAGWVSYAVAPGVSATVGIEHHTEAFRVCNSECRTKTDSELAGLAYLQMNF
jgi:predicted porin